MILVWLAIAGGLGATARFVIDGILRARFHTIGSVGTVVINVIGSLGLGFLAGVVSAQLFSESVRLVVGTGFLGGFTTFSTASFETVRLMQQGRRRLAVAMLFVQLGLALLFAALGYALGLWL